MMRYFVFYKDEVITGKGCAISENNIEEWLHEEKSMEVSADEYNSIGSLDYKTFKRCRYRLQLGACTHCNSDYSESEQWFDDYAMNFRHICGNCQIGTLPVVKILAIKEN